MDINEHDGVNSDELNTLSSCHVVLGCA